MQEKKTYKPYYHEFLSCYVCGNPYCGEEINQYTKDKCPECGNVHDWFKDK